MPRRYPLRGWIIGILSGIIAVAALIIGSVYGNVHAATLNPKIIAWACAAGLVMFGILATARLSLALGHLVARQSVPAAEGAVRFISSAVGYLIVLFGTFEVLDVSVQRLLVGAGAGWRRPRHRGPAEPRQHLRRARLDHGQAVRSRRPHPDPLRGARRDVRRLGAGNEPYLCDCPDRRRAVQDPQHGHAGGRSGAGASRERHDHLARPFGATPNTAPANAAPTNVAPANTSPPSTAAPDAAPANTAPDNTAPANTAPDHAPGASGRWRHSAKPAQMQPARVQTGTVQTGTVQTGTVQTGTVQTGFVPPSDEPGGV